MIRIHVGSTLLSFALAGFALSALSPLQANAENSGCSPAVQSTRTDFPSNAQVLGQFGTVQVGIQINADGRAASAQVTQSSGHASLDQAAVQSVIKYWTFDVAHCNAADLSKEQTVDVVFKRAKSVTIYGTTDRTAIAAIAKLKADDRCSSTQSTAASTVFSCISAKPADDVVADAGLESAPTR